jgi:hypothetical protein
VPATRRTKGSGFHARATSVGETSRRHHRDDAIAGPGLPPLILHQAA